MTHLERDIALLALGLTGCTVGLDPLPVVDVPVSVAWQPLGDSVAAFGVTQRRVALQTGALAIDPAGRIYAGWADPHSGQNEVYLRMWDGTQWQGLGGSEAGGGISQTAEDSRLGAIDFDDEQRPIVAWLEVPKPGLGGVYVKRWDGSDWQPIGDSTTGMGLARTHRPWWPSLVVSGTDRPTVGWNAVRTDVTPARHPCFVRRWDGQQWNEIEGSASDFGVSGEVDATLVKLAGDPLGTLHVVWQESATERIHHVAYSPGRGWHPLGDSSAISPETFLAKRADLVIAGDGAPIVSFDTEPVAGGERSVRVLRWDVGSGQWRGLGLSAEQAGISEGLQMAQHASIAVDREGGVIVAFEAEDAVGTNIHVRRWDGQSWINLARPIARGGLSATTTASTFPAVAVGERQLVVAWQEELVNELRVIHLLARPTF